MSSSTLLMPSRVGRPADRQDLIVQEIRDRIVAGELRPGSRLPTREEIGIKYGAGTNTVQRALDRLRLDGFIEASGRNGTHVSNEPPHLTQCAIVFPCDPLESGRAAGFYTALNNEAIEIKRIEGRKLKFYYGVGNDPTSDAYQTLLRDAVSHCLGGIVFTTPAQHLYDTPITDEPAIARVCIMSPEDGGPFPMVYPDVKSFFEKSLQFLKAKGCQRIALINPQGLDWSNDTVRAMVEEHGMETRACWNLTVALECPRAAQNLTNLLMSAGQTERPDGLIISDDNLVEYATAGLVDSGVKVGQDLHVVAHSNFPWLTPEAIPVHRLGFDAREVLQAAFACIDAIGRGEEACHVTNIPARFEWEFGS